jgi:hypothetical protein
MAAFAFIAPILPGKEQADKEHMREAVGPRRQDYAEWRRKLGITREAVWHQQTPQGTVAIVYMEADDPQRALQGLGSSTEPIAQWFRQCILEVHGLDLTQPMPGPLPELVIDERF